ncbi:MAG: DUF4331 family protein [Longimicrobiales bacterium]
MIKTNRGAVRALSMIAGFGLVLGAAGCDDNDDGEDIVTPVTTTRTYTQIERLGNPLISEVFFPKRDHGLHNTKSPNEDPLAMTANGTDVPGHIRTFVSQFPNRTEKTITTLQSVFAKDMLMVFPNRPAAGAGWLSWALAAGYGGRNLSDDVVDVGLSAVFGNALDPAQPVLAGLTSDNVPPSVRSFSTTFPYLESPR